MIGLSVSVFTIALSRPGVGVAAVIVVTGGALDFSDPNNSGLAAILFGDQLGGTDPIGAPPAAGTLDFTDPAQSGNAALIFGDESP